MSAEEKDVAAQSLQDLEKYRIPNLPPDFYYIPDFISIEEEASILQKIPPNRWTHLTHRRLQAHPSTLTSNNTLLASPLPTYLTHPIISRFTSLGIFSDTPHQSPNHVLINEYRPGEGIMPHEDGDAYAPVVATVSLGGMLPLELNAKVASWEDAESAYESHVDSNGNPVPLPAPPEEPVGPVYSLPTRILQEPRSLLVTRGEAYRVLRHGISSLNVDEGLGSETVANWELLGADTREKIERDGGRSTRGTRVSLTYRDVLKVSKAAGKVFGLRR